MSGGLVQGADYDALRQRCDALREETVQLQAEVQRLTDTIAAVTFLCEQAKSMNTLMSSPHFIMISVGEVEAALATTGEEQEDVDVHGA